MGQGFYWQDLAVGQRLKTFRRTVTESDLVGFINVTGMLEAIFIDAGYSEKMGAIKGRVVPAALTFSMLELSMKALGPVLVGDAVWATVEVTGVRPTSKDNRAIISSQVEVFNQHGKAVLSYSAVRMLAGRP
jgi:acyl dehydratase